MTWTAPVEPSSRARSAPGRAAPRGDRLAGRTPRRCQPGEARHRMYRYMTRLAITGVWVLVGALVLLACAPGAPAARPAAPAAQPAAPTASGATPNSASDWDALVAAARAEGALALAGPS